MDESTPARPKDVTFPAKLAQLKTLKNESVTVTLITSSRELQKVLKLITACQAGNSLSISARIIKAKPVKKDATQKPNTQKKGPRRVRRYPYR